MPPNAPTQQRLADSHLYWAGGGERSSAEATQRSEPPSRDLLTQQPGQPGALTVQADGRQSLAPGWEDFITDSEQGAARPSADRALPSGPRAAVNRRARGRGPGGHGAPPF